MNAKDAEAILLERARRLAQPPPAALPDEELIRVVRFSLGGERYAIESAYVREIARLVDLTPVPGAGTQLAGLTNLRGEILAVFELRDLFGLPIRGLTDLSRIVVLGTDRNDFGVLADETHAIEWLRGSDLVEPPAAAGIRAEYVRGVTKEAVILLDGAALLRDPRLYIDQTEMIRQEG